MGFLAISVIILVLAGIWVYDRRQRRKGHVFRSPGDMMSAERQQRRSATRNPLQSPQTPISNIGWPGDNDPGSHDGLD
jgi:hypothetical protein